MSCCKKLNITCLTNNIEELETRTILFEIFDDTLPIFEKNIYITNENIFQYHPKIILSSKYIFDELNKLIYMYYYIYSQYMHIYTENEKLILTMEQIADFAYEKTTKKLLDYYTPNDIILLNKKIK